MGKPLNIKILEKLKVIENGVNNNKTEINNAIKFKTIAINTDFNSIRTTSIYAFGSSPTGANKPCNTSGFLEVFTNGVLSLQRYTTYNGQVIYQRGYYNGWTAWVKTNLT